MADGWLLFIHQLPPTPAYLRVKVGRRLHKIGAVQLKQTVYVLPLRDEQLEDFQWLRKEIVADGGDATICEANFVGGHSDDDVIALFRATREPEWQELVADLRRTVDAGAGGGVARLRTRFDQLSRIDFFHTHGKSRAVALLQKLEAFAKDAPSEATPTATSYQGRTWVTREKMKVDRLACAWLIKRFIDSDAAFKLVASNGYKPKDSEILFDMFDIANRGDVEVFTHEGDKCTFEVLLERTGVADEGLSAIAEIVHDIDVKDGRFDRPETGGVAAMIDAVALHNDDNERLKRASLLFDDLHALFLKTTSCNANTRRSE